MDSELSVRQVEAHDEAGEQFATALKRSFPAIADQITPDALLSFHGTIRGRDVICTFQQLKGEKSDRAARFLRHYDPAAPEVRERRKRLFHSIEAGHSEAAALALRELAHAYGAPRS